MRRILLAVRCSFMGFAHAWKYEAAFRQEIALTLLLVPLAMLLGRTGVERVILVGSCLLVLIVELLNSAIEAAVDRVGDEHHELSGRAKDLGSAAVFVSLLAVATVWFTVAWQRLIG
jgi:diacylglycerol kinase (ATP)